MTTFVLASSPLVGPTSVEPLGDALRVLGHTVSTPPVPADLEAFVGAVSADLAQADEAVLVPFSAAGPRAFAVADVQRPRAIVFLDARLPADGHAPDAEPAFAKLLDALPQDADGRLPVWSTWWPDEVMSTLCPDPVRRAELVEGCPRVPRAMFSQPIPAPAYDGPCGFVMLSEAYRDQRDVAAERGWPVSEVEAATHLSPFVDPDVVASALVSTVERLH